MGIDFCNKPFISYNRKVKCSGQSGITGNIIRTGITCKHIPSYMRDSACRCFIVKKAKTF